MSIVNDALKKAGKEFEFKAQDTITSVHKTKPSSDKKWPMMIPMIFVVMAILVGVFFLHRNVFKTNPNYIAGGSDKSGSLIQSTLNNIEQKNTAKTMKSQNIAKLNGIVYGDGDKWAIVNDKIVKEGDNLLGGEIISITRDIVRIEKKDGNEIVLGLK